MPRDIPIGNGNLLVNLDADYRIRDIYFPHIGQEDHSNGSTFRFGVWADGRCSWMGPEWEKDLRYVDNSLVTDVHLANEAIGLRLTCSDTVDIDSDVYIKKLTVRNMRHEDRRVRLFFCHDFHLYGNDIGGTAFFDPRTGTVVHYKANRYFLIDCLTPEGRGVSRFTCSNKEGSGKPTAWEDAEDGELDGNPISWGSTTSAIGLTLDLPAGGSATAYYWIVAATSYKEAAKLDQATVEKTPEEMIIRTSAYWEAWAQNETRDFGDLPGSVTDIYSRSLLILRTQIDNRGAIIAATDSDIVRFGRDTYSYMWGRDGAFVAAALSEAGYPLACRKFFNFCSRVLADEGYLFQHYNPDGSLASNWHPWLVDGEAVLPIQEDSTALILWALWLEYENSKDIEFIRPLYRSLILKSAEFMLAHRDPKTLMPLPSYDLWEERYAVHSFTVAAVIAGLRAAANFASLFSDARLAERYWTAAEIMKSGIDEHLYSERMKRYARSADRVEDGYELDEVIDVSLLGLTILGAVPADEPRMVETIDAIMERLWLKTPVGGCARYENDMYQRPPDYPPDVPGNPWFISTLWLGETLIARAKSLEELHEALPYLEWCGRNALPSGVFAEQVHPLDSSPLSVSPLTWSHSSFVWAVLLYSEKYAALTDGCDGSASTRD